MRKKRTMRKPKRSKALKRSSKVKRSKVKSPKKSKKRKGKKKMNAYMEAKEKARKSGAETFTYNGTTYKKTQTKTGMVIYKKA